MRDVLRVGCWAWIRMNIGHKAAARNRFPFLVILRDALGAYEGYLYLRNAIYSALLCHLGAVTQNGSVYGRFEAAVRKSLAPTPPLPVRLATEIIGQDSTIYELVAL